MGNTLPTVQNVTFKEAKTSKCVTCLLKEMTERYLDDQNSWSFS